MTHFEGNPIEPEGPLLPRGWTGCPPVFFPGVQGGPCPTRFFTLAQGSSPPAEAGRVPSKRDGCAPVKERTRELFTHQCLF
jgi:hypothetical protein